MRSLKFKTRNSAVADKLTRVAFVQCNGMIDILKHAPPHVYYHAKIGRSALKALLRNDLYSVEWDVKPSIPYHTILR